MAPTATNLWWVAAVGAGGSCLVAARGAANLPAMFLLWALYHSLVNVGQTWYSFGEGSLAPRCRSFVQLAFVRCIALGPCRLSLETMMLVSAVFLTMLVWNAGWWWSR